MEMYMEMNVDLNLSYLQKDFGFIEGILERQPSIKAYMLRNYKMAFSVNHPAEEEMANDIINTGLGEIFIKILCNYSRLNSYTKDFIYVYALNSEYCLDIFGGNL